MEAASAGPPGVEETTSSAGYCMAPVQLFASNRIAKLNSPAVLSRSLQPGADVFVV